MYIFFSKNSGTLQHVSNQLRSQIGWPTPNTATDSTGFAALPSAVRWGGSFSIAGEAGFWSTTEVTPGTSADTYYIDPTGAGADMGSETSGYSIRCVRDY
jgi:uncharacterized protein (TIGR02145 family)